MMEPSRLLTANDWARTQNVSAVRDHEHVVRASLPYKMAKTEIG